MTPNSLLLFLTKTLFLLLITTSLAAAAPGRWRLLQRSIGISAMHVQLLNTDRVVIFDRTDFGPSNLSLPAGHCRQDTDELALKTDCTAHSVEYDVHSNTFRPLNILTDTWCSSGSLLPDGRLAQSGGFNDGERVVRMFTPCRTTSCDWNELGRDLLVPRWYASNHRLPNGQMIIVGGRAQFNYEFYPKTPATNTLKSLPFLSQTNDPNAENNLYPFIFLNTDGNLFIFANNRAILLNYTDNSVVKTYPKIPGGDPRCYPSTGSAALLPLKNIEANTVEAEVLVCGGAPTDSYIQALKGNFVGGLKTCARMKITEPNPKWVMETMPMERVLGDMVLLPNGRVMIVNGIGSGSAGWELGRNATLAPVIYNPDAPAGKRFETQAATKIPRVYHSSAVLLRDGRVMVGGSNPHGGYVFTGVLYPTELSLEAFWPSYLDRAVRNLRPRILSPRCQTPIKYGKKVTVEFSVEGAVDTAKVRVTMVAPPFNTHSFSQGQRMLELTVVGGVEKTGKSNYQVVVKAPSNGNIAMPGYYMLFVVNQDIPSGGIWVKIQ